MSIIKFIRIFYKYQSPSKREGFLCIELLMSLLVMGILVLVASYYHALSLQWQQEAIKRFEAVNKATSWIVRKKSMNTEVLLSGREVEDDYTLSWQVDFLSKPQLPFIEKNRAHNIRVIMLDVAWYDAYHQEHHIPFVTLLQAWKHQS